MSNERLIAGQLVVTSTTPPGNIGLYAKDEDTIGVVGDLVCVDPKTKAASRVERTNIDFQTVSASRTLTVGDAGQLLVCSSSSAIVLTVPGTSSGVTWDGPVVIACYRSGTGSVTFAAGDGVTIHGDLSTPAQYGSKGIVRVGVNEWAVIA